MNATVAPSPAPRLVRRLLRLLCVLAIVLAGPVLPLSASAGDGAAKRVLIVHSFAREIAPYDAGIAAFRRDLASRSPEPVVFMEAALDAGRAIGPAEQAAFLTYLRARFSDPPPDLIVSSGGPAAQFVARHRDAIAPGVPLLLTAVETRVVPRAALRPGDSVVANRIELPMVFDNVVRVLPDVTTIAVILGATPLERYWRQQIQKDTAYLAGRVKFLWLDGLSLPQLKQRVATLPPHSAIYYGLMIVDGAGVPHEGLRALSELRQVANAPIFSIFEAELGQGGVGGPFVSTSLIGADAATMALRRLAAPPLPGVQEAVVGMNTFVYDARELRRWGIPESRLPPGSEVRFQPRSPWAQYRAEIIGIVIAFALLLALIAALLVQRAHRRRAELAARTLGGRLMTAYEDEGRRLARELHDDITQRLAGLSIEAAALGRITGPAARAAAEQSIGNELASLSRDVHALSYRLHPSVVDDLGLEEALRIECERAARRGGPVEVAFQCETGGADIRGETALCLFRVAQESLRNALRHAGARRITVSLQSGPGEHEVRVEDDGCGFDLEADRARASLGLASMRERVALLDGQLDVRSRPGHGTSVAARVPVAEAAP